MKELRQGVIMVCLAIMCCSVFAFCGVADALDIVVEPAAAQRKVGEKVRLHFYADSAVDLLSMGIKVSFDASILQASSASKYEDVDDGWLMDADGDSGTTDDQYNDPPVEIDNTGGSVTMIGGHLKGPGPGTTGLSGKVLLGWIVFDAMANGDSLINVDLGKYHPEDPTKKFNNFVNVDGSVDEPTNVPGDLAIICVRADACSGDINGNGAVDMGDFALMRAAMGTSFPDPGYNLLADLNGNGSVDMGDFAILRGQMGTSGCPTCSLP